MTESNIERFLDLLRNGRERHYPVNPGVAWEPELPTFKATTISVPIGVDQDWPQHLESFGSLLDLHRIRRELRRLGFDVGYRVGEAFINPLSGREEQYGFFYLRSNEVSEAQVVGAVGLSVDEQVARVIQALDEIVQQPTESPNGLDTRPLLDKVAERRLRFNFLRWAPVEVLHRLGICDLDYVAEPLRKAGIAIEVRPIETVLQLGEIYTYGTELADATLQAKRGAVFFRFKKAGVLEASVQSPHITKDAMRLHVAIKRFKGGQWLALKSSDMERLQAAGLLDGRGWPTEHEAWADVREDELKAWRIGRSTEELKEFQRGDVFRGQTFGGVPRSVPLRLEPVTRAVG